MAATRKDGAMDSLAGPATEVGEIELTAEERLGFDEAERATKAWLKEHPKVEVYVPKGIFAPKCLVIYNGVKLEIPIAVPTKVPAPIAEILNVRIANVQEGEEAARRSHGAS